MRPGATAVDTIGAPLRLFNTAAQWLPVLDTQLPRVEEAVAEAPGRMPGLEPDDDSWLPALTAFLSALGTDADLTPAGRHFARRVVLGGLTNRLRVHRAVAEDPGIARRPVGPAVVVVGLPRSGTTLLQHLLALGRGNRSLRHWEAAHPAPPPGRDPVADAQRLRSAERAIRLVDLLLPHARTLHPTGARLPTECASLFANSFASLELGVLYQVPSYVRWCLGADMRPHYGFYAQQLQVIGRYGDRERWVLKSPSHLFWLEELARALPESRFVVLHRDPLEVLPSFCRLAALASGATARRVSRSGIGRLWSEAWAEGVRRSVAARSQVPEDRWVDVRYAALVADPVRTVGEIHEALGIPFDDRAARAVLRHVAANPQPGPRPSPRLEDYGLDAATERCRFEEAAAPAGPGGSVVEAVRA